MRIEDTFSISRASELLHHTRRTVRRALRDVPPDVEKDGVARWSLFKIVAALEGVRRSNREQGREQGRDQQRMLKLVDAIEHNFDLLSDGLKLLEAEPDLEKRRQLNAEHGIGKLIGTLDRQMIELNQLTEFGAMLTIVSDKMIGVAASRFFSLLDLWPPQEELAAIRDRGGTAGEAR